MSDLLDKAHADVALTLLNTTLGGLSPPIPVHDGRVPDDATLPYVLVYTQISRPIDADGNAFDGLSAAYLVRWYCHCVGATAAAARAVGMQVRTALLDVRPTISGRACGMIRQEDTLAPDRDETTGTLVMDAVQIYSLRTLPG